MSNSMTYERLNNLDVWDRMPTITLDQMSAVKLMNRIDTKYVISDLCLIPLLERMASMGYSVQIIDAVRACRYKTLYYDTTDREMFRVHHNRKLTRQKLRTRTYVESGETFFEIKNKSNRGRTKKRRTTIDIGAFEAFHQSEEALSLLREYSQYNSKELSPALSTHFTRITLINPTHSERITIDLDLSYRDMRSGNYQAIDHMAIIELKQSGNSHSTTKQLLRDMHISPLKVSKYCLGTTLTVDDIRSNRFKEKIRLINKQLERLANTEDNKTQN
jgi:hypothetical protein